MSLETRNFIGGEFVPAQSAQWLERQDPLTHRPLTRVPDSDLLDVVRAVQAANKAWSAWSRVEGEARADHLRKIAERLKAREDEFAHAVSLETGTPIARARISAARAREVFGYLSEAITAVRPTDETAEARFWNHRLPIGLVAIVSPLDEPLFTLGSRVAAALSAGNVVIAKPSSHAPRTAQLFAECVLQAGLPAGVFNLVQGRGERVGAAIAQHPGISTVSFTGSTDTGRRLQINAAEFLKRTQLALGACNSVLVLDGVDLVKTSAAVARLCLTGLVPQALKGQRVFVQDSIYKKFLEAFQTAVERIATGDPRLDSTELGPLARSRDVEGFRRAVAQARSEKGKLLVGGVEPQEGNFVRPTVVYDLHLCSTLQQDEVTGPLALVESVKYPHDAIRHTNTSPLGSAAYVFHPDGEAARKIAERIECGRVFINTAEPPWSVRATYGGLKLSGLGAEGGLASLMFFSRQSLLAMPRIESS